MSNRWLRWVAAGIVILIIVPIVVSFFRSDSNGDEIDLSEVIALARDGRVESIEVRGDSLTVRLRGEMDTIESRKESDVSMAMLLEANGVQVGGPDGVAVTVKGSGPGSIVGVIINFIPLVIFGLILIFMMARSSSGFGRRRDDIPMRHCPACSEHVPQDSRYCNHCGQPLPTT